MSDLPALPDAGACFVTWDCDCKRLASEGLSFHPRYCGNGRPILRRVPPMFRRDWSAFLGRDDEPSKREPFPAPIVRARPATNAETPPSIQRLAALARANGWDVSVTYAEGYGMHATTGRPTAVKRSILLRAHAPDGTRIGAQWLNGATDPNGRKVLHPDGTVEDLSADDVKHWLGRRLD